MTTFLKSTGAVLAGFLAIVILSILTDKILEKAGIFPEVGLFDTWLLVIAFIYRSIYAVVGGFITGKLYKKSSTPVTVLGILGTIGGIAGVYVGWNLSDHWYPIALAVTAYPLVWWGGKLVRNI